MTTIRKRDTGHTFFRDTTNNQVTQTPSTEPLHNASNPDQLIRDFIDKLSARISPTMPQAKKIAALTRIRRELLANRDHVEDMINNSHLYFDLLTKPVRRSATDRNSPSFLRHIAQVLLSAKIPGATVLLSLLPTVAASWTSHEGQPAGGADLCAGILFGCLQGDLSWDTQLWTLGMPRWVRRVDQVSKDADIPHYQTLRDCMSAGVMGNLAKSVAADTNSTAMGYCSATSSPWQGWVTSGQLSGVPQQNCLTFQNAFQGTSSQCMSSWNALKNSAKDLGLIVGVPVGIVGGLALLALVGYYFKEKISQCCEKKEDHVGRMSASMSMV
jgi:hypothetical protein